LIKIISVFSKQLFLYKDIRMSEVIHQMLKGKIKMKEKIRFKIIIRIRINNRVRSGSNSISREMHFSNRVFS
jgi:hypothetical protein